MNYTTNNENIKYRVFIVSILIFLGLSYFLRNSLKEWITDNFFLFLTFYIISLFFGIFTLYSLIAKMFFKIPFLKRTIPNFNGEWKGKGESNYGKDKKKSFDVKIEIRQSLTDISINAYFPESKSEALNCYVVRENNKDELIYNYFNVPKENKNLQKHYGTICLELKDNQLTGNYFTDRKSKGFIYLSNNE